MRFVALISSLVAIVTSPLPSSSSDQQLGATLLWVAILGTIGTLIATLPALISSLSPIFTSFGKKQYSFSNSFSPKVLSIKRIPLEVNDWRYVRKRTFRYFVLYNILFIMYIIIWIIIFSFILIILGQYFIFNQSSEYNLLVLIIMIPLILLVSVFLYFIFRRRNYYNLLYIRIKENPNSSRFILFSEAKILVESNLHSLFEFLTLALNKLNYTIIEFDINDKIIEAYYSKRYVRILIKAISREDVHELSITAKSSSHTLFFTKSSAINRFIKLALTDQINNNNHNEEQKKDQKGSWLARLFRKG